MNQLLHVRNGYVCLLHMASGLSSDWRCVEDASPTAGGQTGCLRIDQGSCRPDLASVCPPASCGSTQICQGPSAPSILFSSSIRTSPFLLESSSPVLRCVRLFWDRLSISSLNHTADRQASPCPSAFAGRNTRPLTLA